ncbi:MAG: rhomboid family intramembrane serine protease [Microcystaceae cyanobacterium]
MQNPLPQPWITWFNSLIKRQTTGSIVCPNCGQLISVQANICPHCQYNNPSLFGFSGTLKKLAQQNVFLSIVVWGCGFIYLATLAADIKGVRTDMDSLSILSPSNLSLIIFGSTGAIPVFQFGRWWTIFTAGWLHGNLLHIAFNLAWLSYLVPSVQQLFGVGRLTIIYIISGVVGSLLTSIAGQYWGDIPLLGGASFSVGASGAVFGLFGALAAYGQVTKDGFLRQRYWTYAIVFLLLGMMRPGVDNWGHLGGFIGGYGVSWLLLQQSIKGEKIQHLLIGLGLLLMTVFSFMLSILHGLFLIFSRSV